MSNAFVIYVSRRTDPTDGMLVRDIAIEASQKNREREISGMLMAVGNHFLQVLEGEPTVLDDLLERIAKDPRHYDLKVLYRGNLPDRIFGHWSMGCVRTKETNRQSAEHFDEIANQIEELCHDFTREKSEALKALIVRIPQLIAEESLCVA